MKRRRRRRTSTWHGSEMQALKYGRQIFKSRYRKHAHRSSMSLVLRGRVQALSFTSASLPSQPMDARWLFQSTAQGASIWPSNGLHRFARHLASSIAEENKDHTKCVSIPRQRLKTLATDRYRDPHLISHKQPKVRRMTSRPHMCLTSSSRIHCHLNGVDRNETRPSCVPCSQP